MGNFCGLCSCIYPKLDEFDDEEYFNKYAIERKRVVTEAYSNSASLFSTLRGASADVSSISSYSSKTALVGGAFAGLPRRHSLASQRLERLSLGLAAAERQSAEIFTIYSPAKFAARDHMLLWPGSSLSKSSSIVSLNDHKLFLEVADLHMSEIKRQLRQHQHDNASMFTTLTRQSLEDSGINMSLNASLHSSSDKSASINDAVVENKATPLTLMSSRQLTVRQGAEPASANHRGGRDDDEHNNDDDGEREATPLVFFQTINAIASSLIKNAYFNTSLSVGTNYLYKWSTKNSITKLRSKMFKLASFPVAAFVANTKSKLFNTNKSAAKKLALNSSTKAIELAVLPQEESTTTSTDVLFSHEVESSLYASSYSFARTSPLRQFILRVYDANFF